MHYNYYLYFKNIHIIEELLLDTEQIIVVIIKILYLGGNRTHDLTHSSQGQNPLDHQAS